MIRKSEADDAPLDSFKRGRRVYCRCLEFRASGCDMDRVRCASLSIYVEVTGGGLILSTSLHSDVWLCLDAVHSECDHPLCIRL